MLIRPATAADLTDLQEIDGTVESLQYAHVEQTNADGHLGWRIDWRPTREKLILPGALSDDTGFSLRQILNGADDGIALTAEHDDTPIALLLAQPDAARGVMRVLDLRVEYDLRRQGIATVLLYQLIERAKDGDLRAAYITTRTNNAPAARLLEKLGWELSGIDTKRHDNHDLVKESATLIWYYVIK